jgi:glycosyltransferase involved in cell wall biosynthesis
LEAYVRELGVEEAVRFLGFVSPVSRAFEDAAIAVVPSLGEGFGMVALEAMERARPVIASAVGGLPEIVAEGETGLVVPASDADALAEAIVALASDLPRAEAMGAAGRERALREFTPERCVERTEELYARALEPTPT